MLIFVTQLEFDHDEDDHDDADGHVEDGGAHAHGDDDAAHTHDGDDGDDGDDDHHHHDDAGDDGDEVGHQHTAAEHAEILTAAEVEATAMFSSTNAQDKLDGDVIRPAAVMQRIVFDNDDAVTTLTIRIDEAG